ncbi:MAG TPA: hypothetical protein PLU87_00145 [Sedimentisphaerales bacterium]|nr:hypothetical protein [Sedimentisphaerales bacterium]HRS09713.1 hypothetical protein [Sedimentisphaerales bacterium]HRV46394.1 hypothetical protein [Sedimentisphaerales bacterium]
MAPLGPWKWTPEVLEQLARDLLEWAQDPNVLFLKEFCCEHNIPSAYIAQLSARSPVFAEAVDRVNDILEVRVLRGGLEGKLEHHIVKLVASAKYGVCERNDLAVSATPGPPVLDSIEACDKAIAQAQATKAMFLEMIAQANALPSAVIDG